MRKFNMISAMFLVAALSLNAVGCKKEEQKAIDTSISEMQELNLELETTFEVDTESSKEAQTEEVTSEIQETTTEEETTTEPETTTLQQIQETTTKLYTVTNLDKVMYVKSSVNVRKGPNREFERLGSLKANQQVKVTGKSDQTGWYRIEYNGTEAYVSNSYLQDKPVETTTPKPTTTKKPSGGSSNKNEETTEKPKYDSTTLNLDDAEYAKNNPNFLSKHNKHVIAYNADGSYDVKNCIFGTGSHVTDCCNSGVSSNQMEEEAYLIFLEKLGDKLEIPEGWYTTIGKQRRYKDLKYRHYDIRDYKLCVMKKVGEGYCWIFDENFNLKKVSLSDTN